MTDELLIHLFNVEEYHRLGQIGVLPEDADVELLDGIVFDRWTEDSPTEHRFSVDDYHRMAETGILPPDARVELLDGQIIDMLPIGPFHADIGTRLHALLAGAANGRWVVRNQYPVQLSDGSEPQPDFALVRPRAEFYQQHHPRPDDIFLLIEVADSSVRSDRKGKLSAYAKAGIVEYWIVNLSERVVEMHREPVATGSYQSVVRVDRTGSVSPAAFPDVVIPLANLL